MSWQTGAMPADNRLRPEDFERVEHLGRQAIEPTKHQGIDVADGYPLRRFAPQHIELVSKDKDFKLQCGPRPEQPGYRTPD
jgi:hypothetical protein